jgi:uncharacterized protein YdhG (YjbR/CyaY superfamily)
MATPENIDSYIATFPAKQQEMMRQLRQIISEAAPEATEKISWAMPTYYQNGNVVHFAAHANHIGFYPSPSGINKFQRQFAGLKFSKGAVQFPLDKPLPVDLIKQMVAFRVAENLKK